MLPATFPLTFPSTFPAMFPATFPSMFPAMFPAMFPSMSPATFPSMFSGRRPWDDVLNGDGDVEVHDNCVCIHPMVNDEITRGMVEIQVTGVDVCGSF